MAETMAAPTVDTTTGDHERFAHYVWAPEGRAAAIVLEAAVSGVPVRALCGKLWVPSRDPSRFPVCPDCADIKRGAQEGRSE